MMKCDLHCHTSYSEDSNASPEEMVEAAIKKGVNCLAITDHDEIKGAIKAAEFALGKSILIIPSIEIKSQEGDILGLNITKIIEKNLSAEETLKRIKEAGGLAVIPHPFGFAKHKFKGNLKKLINKIDCIEVLNSTMYGSANKKAFDFAKKFNLSFTAGSDAHFPNMVGKVYLEIPGNNLSVEEVLKRIINKEYKLGGQAGNFTEKFFEHFKRYPIKIKGFLNNLIK